jgi:hypothetical protein
MSDYIKSDYCTECDGEGFVYLIHENPSADNDKEQCAECEELHQQELYADRLHDEMKGN